jgi:hypothetical protein
MKTATAKAPNQERQEAKVEMIPARVAWDHVDRLDGLNEALNELSGLVAGANDLDVPVPALVNLLRDQYRQLRIDFAKSVGPESPATAKD